ncbi:hypothetical protein [Leifsonia sp. P73]|uniref:hypothetical protein n=1 Tax=Leifsonia sp. P73 TaxID=3423959 RepID=UPI003DA4B293
MEENAEARELFAGATELVAWEPLWRRHYEPEYVPTGDEVWHLGFDNPDADGVISGYLVFPADAGRHPADLVDLPGELASVRLELTGAPVWTEECPGMWTARLRSTGSTGGSSD